MSTHEKTVQNLLTYPDPGQICDALRKAGFAQLLAGLSAPTIDASARTVTTHVCSFVDSNGDAEYGFVLNVESTAGSTTGVMHIVVDKAPATGEVKLEYVDGQPKLTFNAGDAVTACKAHWVSTGTYDGNSLAANLASELGAG